MSRHPIACPRTRLPPIVRGARLAAVALLGGTLAACAQPHQLYNWQSYQPVVYAGLKEDGGDPMAQAEALEKNLETAKSSDHALPPGFRAHLGMLYLKQGKADLAFAQLESEKAAFPESAVFMDFLLNNAGSQSTPTAAAVDISEAK